ncbi:MAG: hypothetical protein AUJ28_01200 [Parcubacteria group bacterium CG1_02_37_51]|uniref:Ferritin n=2 Tax=Candidatus Komeiliibacteriota TaxID=1817908 RepID=A0A2M8DR37_9BACT|nr:MAG: hypothetical protein AUJ28_01200 [Parcubacteria group bacterium CG1_02_37_51]PIY93911.1 MAG: ferritin [Candidatus Komeilibacteria bacterium CG_4_10_14_0_8_um_filter_37_78]PJC01808.1 MAG: ferritin [Candidatus Komeilibacteria bacterium CG_4_9_14_0_8_um_filter_36_9]
MAYDVPVDKLPQDVHDRNKAIESLREELNAIDFYDQRMHVVVDEELKKIIAHNRDEEKEHAAMLIKWLRKNDPVFDKEFDEHDQV